MNLDRYIVSGSFFTLSNRALCSSNHDNDTSSAGPRCIHKLRACKSDVPSVHAGDEDFACAKETPTPKLNQMIIRKRRPIRRTARTPSTTTWSRVHASNSVNDQLRHHELLRGGSFRRRMARRESIDEIQRTQPARQPRDVPPQRQGSFDMVTTWSRVHHQNEKALSRTSSCRLQRQSSLGMITAWSRVHNQSERTLSTARSTSSRLQRQGSLDIVTTWSRVHQQLGPAYESEQPSRHKSARSPRRKPRLRVSRQPDLSTNTR
jgi:hypothetical protein